MTLKERLLLIAIVALVFIGLYISTVGANDDDPAVKEFVKEMCAMEGMIRIKFDEVEYDCKEVRKWK